ncbi:MAG: phosphoenolpyruvate--protein phosphotransferase [Spirochaetaceae bacterium]|nr:phosphoenolpyruvate--protein phosphotransferase [Spirochaetaceae bacterium]
MREFHGIAASPGIAIHHAFAHYSDAVPLPKYSINESDIETEWERYINALERAAAEIRGIKETLGPSHTDQHQLLDAQLLMLRDPEMSDYINKRIPDTLRNVEWILSEFIDQMVAILEASGDEYLAERSLDVMDVSRRITNHLLYRERLSLSTIDREVILVSPNLLPSETVLLDPTKVRGIALDAGGRTSHTAILARSFGIPSVLGLRDLCRTVKPEDLLIVDGDSGIVIVDPDKETLLQYRAKLGELEKQENQLIGLRELPAESLDGYRISLMANIERPEEIETVLNSNAEGIGLFRSEFLFMDPRDQPDEDVQFNAYVRVLNAMEGKPVTIRTLDVGGDKLLPSMEEGNENNPLLGWRAIRFCLEEQEIFRVQLRALLRASAHGNLKIMFPLISNSEELDQALRILYEERQDLAAFGTPMAEELPVGIMIEVPSAALISDILARKADFFSIGTNDLIQYTMAVDRGNEKIALGYQPFHPALWRLMKMTVDNAKAAGIPVSVCGEVASDPIAAMLLMALGLDELSMGAFGIPAVKHIIRSVSAEEARIALDEVMGMATAEEVESYLRRWMGDNIDRFE